MANGEVFPRADTRLTLREILTPVFYHKWLAIAAFTLPVTLAVLAALVAPVTQIADSKLLILLGKDYVFQNDSANGALAFDRNQIVQAEMEILGARDVHADALTRVGLARVYPGLAKDPKGLDKALKQFEKDLSIGNVPQSNVIEIQFRNSDSQTAIDVVNALDDIYVARRKSVFEQASAAELQAQQADLFKRLSDLDARISDLGKTYSFADYTQALTAAQTDQANLVAHVQSLDEQLASSEARGQRLRTRLSATPDAKALYTDKARSQQVEALTTRLLDLENQRREAAAKYADGYPLIVDLDQKISDVRKQLAAMPADQVASVRIGTNPVYETLDTTLANVQGDVAGLREARVAASADLQRANKRLADLMDIGPAFRELVRNRDILETTYAGLAKKAEESRLSDSLTAGRANVRIVQRASHPTTRKTLRMPLLAAGLGAGIVAAAASVLLASNFRQSLLTPREAEQRLGLPVLLATPHISKSTASRDSAPRLMAPLLSLDDCLLLLRLAVARSGDRSPIIQLIAANEGAGVSSLAVDFAAHLQANTQDKVLLMDIEPPEGRGLIKRLTERGGRFDLQSARHVHPVTGTRLYVSEPAGAKDLIVTDDKWENILGRARNSYGVVVLDSPPPSRSAAGLVIAPFADIVVLVIEAESSRVAADVQLIQRLEASGGSVAGVVFNKRRFHIPKFLYSMT